MSFTAEHILVIADIEGSSGCFNYEASKFLTPEWKKACPAMSRDVDAVVRALLAAGAGTVAVKDFHRTGYNILPEMVDPRARIIHGYKKGPVPGLGSADGFDGVMFIGLHAPSGADAFLAHTMTSRISRLEVNGRLLSEVELFSASLAPYGLRPLFFSGCPEACRQALSVMPWLKCHPIDKSGGPEKFEAGKWRAGLAAAAAEALKNDSAATYEPRGPFKAVVTMRDGPAAAEKIARRWHWDLDGDSLIIHSPDIHDLFLKLAKLAYLNRLTDLLLTPSLFCYDLLGKFGLSRVRRGKFKK